MMKIPHKLLCFCFKHISTAFWNLICRHMFLVQTCQVLALQQTIWHDKIYSSTVTDWDQKTPLAFAPAAHEARGCPWVLLADRTFNKRETKHTFLAPVMVNLNLNALNNCTKTWTDRYTTPMHEKWIDHQSQPLHTKNMSYRHAVNKELSLPRNPVYHVIWIQVHEDLFLCRHHWWRQSIASNFQQPQTHRRGLAYSIWSWNQSLLDLNF